MFRDRTDAGNLLAGLVVSRLAEVWALPDAAGGVVLGLPRGGVPVGASVATALGIPLDVLVVRKVGVPWQPELALGAVGERGVVVLNEELVSTSGLGPGELDALIRKASQEVEDILADLRPSADPPDVTGRMAIVVDDGVATGATARAASAVLRRGGAAQIILATPVAAPSTCESLGSFFDEVICLQTPARFGSVGQHYAEFEQVSNAHVRRLLGVSSP